MRNGDKAQATEKVGSVWETWEEAQDVVLAPSPQIVTREEDGELVVVMPQRGKFIVLNAPGARVMALADGERALHDIAAEIAETFDAPLERVQADVLRFAAHLVTRGVLLPRP